MGSYGGSRVRARCELLCWVSGCGSAGVTPPEAVYPWTVAESKACNGGRGRDFDDPRVTIVLSHGSR